LDKRTQGASLYGATDFEKKTVIAGKLAHYGESDCGCCTCSWHNYLLLCCSLRCFATLQPAGSCQPVPTCCCLCLLTCPAGLLVGLPLALHGPQAALLGALAYSITQSIVLSATFAVSHNVPESKPLDAGQTQVRSTCRILIYVDICTHFWLLWRETQPC
jgi:hypothetical protein